VCLGHQAIGQAFGGRIVRAQRVMHGKLSPVTHDGAGAFMGLPSPLTVTRYHSLSIERASLPPELDVTATADDGEIMGVRHRRFAVEGVQFHPEAILTEHGHALLRNFLEGRS
jgi:anthranilate synthase component 2